MATYKLRALSVPLQASRDRRSLSLPALSCSGSLSPVVFASAPKESALLLTSYLMTVSTAQVLARILSTRWEEMPRDDGSTFTALGGPDDSLRSIARDAIRAAHEEELPNDWRYAVCKAATEELLSSGEDADLSEVASNAAECISTVYTGELLHWYAEVPARISYAEESEEVYGTAEDLLSRLHLGQHLAAERAALLFLEALTSSSFFEA